MTHAKQTILPFVLLLLLAGGATALDLPKMLGAHPWWSVKVIWIGLIIGLVGFAVGAGLKLSGRVASGGFTVLAIASYAVAAVGKTRFAASFAEDAVAGQMWYFGWIATCAFTAAAVLSLFRYWQQNR
ncbi:hypothetical protein J7426_11345 [Tropicibacter sp. R16_0]|uniref:hypothetical protein n=1 Tax=Tropicibacter sp. R16_0 TaxID=2821102 RepID=UPI001ADD1447|nr:hypothetical protein [Tropicibacter sp. R16_0]MBO9450857.1 hypothetical protein [Tropicibacter sp. R16_0]